MACSSGRSSTGYDAHAAVNDELNDEQAAEGNLTNSRLSKEDGSWEILSDAYLCNSSARGDDGRNEDGKGDSVTAVAPRHTDSVHGLDHIVGLPWIPGASDITAEDDIFYTEFT